MEKRNHHPETVCIQGGWNPGNGEPRVLPIYQSTTFKYSSSEQMGRLFDLEEDGYFYTRLANPTNDAVAEKICELEGGAAAMLTSSGQAANYFAVFNICSAGDHIVSAATIYGGTSNLFTVTMKKQGIDVTLVDPDAPEEEIEKAFRPNTKAVFGETIANPALVVLDIEKFARLAHKHGVPLIVDNTFATPINCRPFEWGADIVTHSTTKYMDGPDCGRLYRGQRKFRLERPRRKIPGTYDSGRFLPWRGLYGKVWKEGLYHQGHGPDDAGSGLHPGSHERLFTEYRSGDPAFTGAAPL